MLNGSLDQGSLIYLGCAYTFSIPEPDAYKKDMCYICRYFSTQTYFYKILYILIVYSKFLTDHHLDIFF